MSEKSEQLKKLIESVVRKEVRAIVPQIVKEVMAGMIMESQIGHTTPTYGNTPTNYGNSDKRRSLLEAAAQMDPEPMVGWEGDDMPSIAGRARGRNDIILPDAAMSSAEHGSPIPIAPNQVPEAVVKAMNTNYTEFMKVLNSKTNKHG